MIIRFTIEFLKTNIFSDINGFYLFALFLFISSFIYFTVIALVKIILLIMWLSIVLHIILFIKINQLWLFLSKSNTVNFSEIKLLYFFKHNIECIVFYNDFNRIYGSISFKCCLIIYPTNALLTMMFFLQEKSKIFQIACVVYVITQTLAIVILQFLAIKLSLKFNNLPKFLIQVSVNSIAINDIKLNLKLSQYIADFHTLNKYGLCFGKHGKLDYKSFAKVNI